MKVQTGSHGERMDFRDAAPEAKFRTEVREWLRDMAT